MRLHNFFHTIVWFSVALLALAASAAPLFNHPAAQAVQPGTTKITGDYVEARTASVFAGACHYNSELVTTGRDAVMALKIASGTWKGTDLSGVSAMAAISSEDNLQNEDANRQSEIVVNSSSTAAQSTAIVQLLAKECGRELGKVVSVRPGTVLFDHTGSTYTAKSDGFAEMIVQSMPNDECCKQPNMVWYTPLVPLLHRKVGYTLSSSYSAGTVGDAWQRSEDNTAFYGEFAFN